MSISRMHPIPRFALPYTGADFLAALLAVFQGASPPVAFGLLGDSPKFWTGSGRQSLLLLLQALELDRGSGVALPLFTDPSLVRAILAAGHRPVFIDIDRKYLTIDPKGVEAARGQFAAVVAVHLFGQMADMPALLEAAGDAPVIEDAAHAPLSFLNGRMAGWFGRAAFYSFASTKYWPAGGGGLAIVNDPFLARRLEVLVESLTPPSHLTQLRNVLLQGSKALVFTRELYGFFGYPMRRWAEQWALLEPTLDWKAIPCPYAAVASRQAARFPERAERQRSNSLQLLSLLARVDGVHLPRERPGSRYNYHLFPVLLRDRQEREAVRRALWRRFVDTSAIYSTVVQECRRFGYRGGCPIAESVADRLITLPNHASLSAGEIEQVADIFVSSLRSYRQTRRRCPPFADADLGEPAVLRGPGR
jgi:perosamine synthetase